MTPLALYQETIGWPMAFPCEIWIAIDVACCTASEGIQKFFKTFNLVLDGLPTVTIFKKTF